MAMAMTMTHGSHGSEPAPHRIYSIAKPANLTRSGTGVEFDHFEAVWDLVALLALVAPV